MTVRRVFASSVLGMVLAGLVTISLSPLGQTSFIPAAPLPKGDLAASSTKTQETVRQVPIDQASLAVASAGGFVVELLILIIVASLLAALVVFGVLRRRRVSRQ